MESVSNNVNSDGIMRDQANFQNGASYDCLGNGIGFFVGTYSAGPWDISGGIFGAGFNASFEHGQIEGKGNNFSSDSTMYMPWVSDSYTGNDQQNQQQQVGVIYSVPTQPAMTQGEQNQNYVYGVPRWTPVQTTQDFGPAHAVEASGVQDRSSWSNAERGKGSASTFRTSPARHARGQWFHGSAIDRRDTDRRERRAQSSEAPRDSREGEAHTSMYTDVMEDRIDQVIEDGTFELEFLTPTTSGGDPVPPPSSQAERQLLGEVLFLRVWPIVQSAVTSEDAPKACGKAVGMLLQQANAEECLQNQSALQSRVYEALRALGHDIASGKQKRKDASSSSSALPQEASSADVFPPGMRPPTERHGDLLFMAVSVLVGDSRVASKVTGMLLANYPNEIAKCLTQDKVLRPHVRTALRSLERDQNEEHEAHKLLEEFHGMDTLGRAEKIKGLSVPPDDVGGDSAGGHRDPNAWFVYVTSLLKATLKFTRSPVMVAKEVARSLGVAGLSPTPQVINQLERCGLRRSEFPRLGLKLSRHSHMSSRSQPGGNVGRSFASVRRRSHSPAKARENGAMVNSAACSTFVENEASTNAKGTGAAPSQKSISQKGNRRKGSDGEVNRVDPSWPSSTNRLTEESSSPTASSAKKVTPSNERDMGLSPTSPQHGEETDRSNQMRPKDVPGLTPGLLRVPGLTSQYTNDEDVSSEAPAPPWRRQQAHKKQADPSDSEGESYAERSLPSRPRNLDPGGLDRSTLSTSTSEQYDEPRSSSFLSALLKGPSRAPVVEKPREFKSRDDLFPTLQSKAAMPKSKGTLLSQSDVDRAKKRSVSSEPTPTISANDSRAPTQTDGIQSTSRSIAENSHETANAQVLQRNAAGPRMLMEGLLPVSIPEEAETKKKKKSALVVEAVPEPAKENKKGPKKKGHSWKSVDMFSDVRRERAKSADPLVERRGGSSNFMDEKAKTRVEISRGASTSKNVVDSITAQEARVRLMELAEAKLQAVQNEDFELAAKLKLEERSLQSIAVQGSSWADIAGTNASKTVAPSQTRGRAPWAQSLAANGLRASSEAPRAASSSVDPTLRTRVGDALPASSSNQAKTGETVARKGGLAFFLTAPGQLTLDTFKPTSTHVSRRDALARIASAALWRGRGMSWDTAKEIAFLFEDDNMIRMSPRFAISCPVPSEFQLISVLGRGIERENVPGLEVVEADAGKAFGGHVERVIGEYAKAGRTAVVLLHETHPLNLGIYSTPAESDRLATKDDDRTLIFFLGAVKDMTPEETKAVHRACKLYNVPCVEANLGQQAEFTSKIIDVLHGHHMFGRLVPAAWRCANRRCGSSEGIPLGGLQTFKPAVGAFWVFIPMGGSPRELAHDDKKKDGMYEIPRSCISQLWCSKGEHKGQIVSFVFSTGEVLTVHPNLVTCLKLQHRAAPTERNLVNALRVGIGDQRADPALVIDDGCVALGDIASLSRVSSQVKLSKRSSALIDFSLGGDELHGPKLMPYSVPESEQSLELMGANVRDVPRDVVVLLHQSAGRDFPKGFREKLANVLMGEKASDSMKSAHPRWRRMSLPLMSVNAAISLLSHYRQTGILGLALLTKSQIATRIAEASSDKSTIDRASHDSRKIGSSSSRTAQDARKVETSSSDSPVKVPNVLRRGEPTSSNRAAERIPQDCKQSESSSSNTAVKRLSLERKPESSSSEPAVDRLPRAVGRERSLGKNESGSHKVGHNDDSSSKHVNAGRSRRSESPPPWRKSKGVETETKKRPSQTASHEDQISVNPARHREKRSSHEASVDCWESWLDEDGNSLK